MVTRNEECILIKNMVNYIKELLEFIDRNEKIVFITFGSMPNTEPEFRTQLTAAVMGSGALLLTDPMKELVRDEERSNWHRIVGRREEG